MTFPHTSMIAPGTSGSAIRLTDGAIETAAAILFAYVALSVGRSLWRSRHLSALALAFLGVFALSAPHRAFHAWRLFANVTVTDVVATMVDVSVPICLLIYVLLRMRTHPIAGFTLIADQVGLDVMTSKIDELSARAGAAQQEVRDLRSQLAIEQARSEIYTSQLRAVVPSAIDLVTHAGEIGAGTPPDCRRLAQDTAALHGPLEEFARTLGLP